MAIETGLLTQESGARKSQSAGFAEEHRQGAITALHGLEIQGLTNSTLRRLRAESINQRGPEIIHWLTGREINGGLRHQTGKCSIATTII